MRREKNEILNIYNLTPMQEGMLYHYLYSKEENAYKVQFQIILKGEVEKKLVEESFRELVKKHDVLRTAFVHSKMKRPRQVILTGRPLDFRYKELPGTGEKGEKQFLEEYIKNDWEIGFDLTKDMLIRLTLIKKTRDEYVLLFSGHHIILDGWSWGLLLKDLFINYTRLKQGNKSEPGKVYSYGDYLRWFEKQDKEEGYEYWKKFLDGCEGTGISVLENREAGEGKGYNRKDFRMVIEKRLAESLDRLAKEAGAALNNVLQAVWGILLQRYTGNGDVVFGNVISVRPSGIEGVENAVGLFINTIPLRIRGCEDHTFTELVKEIRDIFIECNKYGFLELAKIEKNSGASGKIIDHLYALENYPAEKGIGDKALFAGSGFEITGFHGKDQTNYNFNLVVLPGEELIVNISYNANAFEEETIIRVGEHIKKVMEEAVKNPGKRIKEIETVPEEEKDKLLYKFNETAATYLQDKTIHGLFEDQAERTPDGVALVGPELQITDHENSCISYKALNEKANQLAGFLMEKGVKPDTIAAIIMEPSVEMIMGILAILKSGGAYLPIDPDYPPERIRYMLNDSGVKVLVTTGDLVEKIEIDNCQLSIIDCQRAAGGIVGNSLASPQKVISDLAYIIYTSGTTGRSKGCMVSHSNVVGLMMSRPQYFDFSSGDVWIMAHSFCFDFSVWEMYGALLRGSRLIVPPRETVRDIPRFLSIIKQYGITILNQTPAAFYALAEREMIAPVKTLHSHLRMVIFGGEKLEPGHLKEWISAYPLEDIRLINMYGITETTVHVTLYPLTKSDILRTPSSSPIGTPLPLTTLHILGKNLELLPIGAAGEFYVGGNGVSRGYLNNPELTKERFGHDEILLPSARRRQKMYKTGDRGRWLPEGTLEYIGRSDRQVKIRGFRIEPDEIKNVLNRHPGVRQSVVMAREDTPGDKRLAAYIVAANPQALTVSGIKDFLSGKLPPYMVPSLIVFLDALPLTTTGKVDYRSLPAPDDARTGIDTVYEAPRSTLEKNLAAIFSEVLGIEKIGIHDNFFQLGGNSIHCIQVIGRTEQLGLSFTVKQLIRTPTVIELAGIAEAGHSASGESAFPAMTGKESQDNSSLVTLQSRGTRPPIFCPHAGGGNVVIYTELARLLGRDQPVYGLQSQGFEPGREPFSRVEDMAAHYLETIRTVQPVGPYFFVGFCLGGSIAFEMALQLQSQGEKVAFLALIDATLDPPESQPETVDFLAGMFPGVLNLSPDRLRRLEPAKQLEYFLEVARMRNALPPEIGIPQLRIILKICKFNFNSWINYTASRPFAGRIHFFRGMNQPPGYPAVEKTWQGKASEGVDIYDIPGDHNTMLASPNADILAEELRRCLEKSRPNR